MNVLRGLTALVAWVLVASAWSYETRLNEVESPLVPGPVAYTVLTPDGFQALKNLPLVLNLHGGGGSRDALLKEAELWQKLWALDLIPPAVVVMPSVTRRGFYMNFKGGIERLEDFIAGPFLTYLRNTYPVSRKAERTFISGISMGGSGALRMANPLMPGIGPPTTPPTFLLERRQEAITFLFRYDRP